MDEWIEYILLEKIQNISANTLFPWEKNHASHIVEQASQRLLDVTVATDNPMQGVAFQL